MTMYLKPVVLILTAMLATIHAAALPTAAESTSDSSVVALGTEDFSTGELIDARAKKPCDYCMDVLRACTLVRDPLLI